MLTIGVDLSAEDTNTCAAAIEWATNAAVVVDLRTEVGNSSIVEWARPAAKIGIDCPFGWPVPFLEFVTEHDRGNVAGRAGLPIDWRRSLANRRTDLFIRRSTPLIPLSVSADRIAHAAMRCAALLAELGADGVAVDRSGQTGKVVEVYPAASLFRWRLAHRGYKRRPNVNNLSQLVDALRSAAPWLDLDGHEATCRLSDDAFDAVIASLTARAAICGLTSAPTPAEAELARREGWIALPFEDSMSRLTGSV